jgi:hypothetical protein
MDDHSKEIRRGKTKKILNRAVIFFGEFSHCGESLKKKENGKIRFNYCESGKKKAQKMENFDKVYRLQN